MEPAQLISYVILAGLLGWAIRIAIDETARRKRDDAAERCQRCGCDNPAWSAASPLWNAVMRGGSINGEPRFNDMVCATCFMILAEEAGVACLWRVQAGRVTADLETVTPSGRVWDAERWLWAESDPRIEGLARKCFSESNIIPRHPLGDRR